MRLVGIICLGLAACMAAAACGGASPASAPPVDQGAVLAGQLLEEGGFRTVSELSGIGGADLTLVSVTDGGLVGSGTTDSGGNFVFSGIDPGDYLLTMVLDGAVNITGSDAGGNVFSTPVSLDPGSVTEIVETFNVFDLDLNGMDDSVELITVIRDDLGNTETDSRLVVPGDQMVMFDTDGDGSFADEDGYLDEDGDGLPDVLTGHMNSLHGGMLKGPIEEITDGSLSVEGIAFAITDATRWKDKGNKAPEMDVFGVGVNVLIRGFYNGEEWVALEVKTTGVRNGGDDGAGGDDSGGEGGEGE